MTLIPPTQPGEEGTEALVLERFAKYLGGKRGLTFAPREKLDPPGRKDLVGRCPDYRLQASKGGPVYVELKRLDVPKPYARFYDHVRQATNLAVRVSIDASALHCWFCFWADDGYDFPKVTSAGPRPADSHWRSFQICIAHGLERSRTGRRLYTRPSRPHFSLRVYDSTYPRVSGFVFPPHGVRCSPTRDEAHAEQPKTDKWRTDPVASLSQLVNHVDEKFANATSARGNGLRIVLLLHSGPPLWGGKLAGRLAAGPPPGLKNVDEVYYVALEAASASIGQVWPRDRCHEEHFFSVSPAHAADYLHELGKYFRSAWDDDLGELGGGNPGDM